MTGPADRTAAQSGPVRPGQRLWTRNFLLLWQGQLVSALGDAMYGIALGFWVLAVTGSTAMMGILMAASALPRVAVSPFAGVVVDRTDRRWMLVLTDAVRGVAVVLVGVAAVTGALRVWMVFAAGVLMGVCAAFFNPAVGSSIPDIVPKTKVVRANSVFSMIYTGSGILGNSAGGFLYQLLGAPLMFLFNGISYLFSAFTELFVRIPKIVHQAGEFRFFRDMKDGYRFVWRIRGLRFLILAAALINFFAVMGIILFLPLFERSPGLGPALYGVFMAFLTAGSFAGMILTSVVEVKPSQRFSVFVAASSLMFLLLVPVPLVHVFPLMAALALLGGVLNSVVNVFVNSVIQVATPGEMRGKVLALLSTVAGGLSPMAMAAGGALAEFFPVRFLIAGAFTVALISMGPLFFSPSFKRFINFDPQSDTTASIS